MEKKSLEPILSSFQSILRQDFSSFNIKLLEQIDLFVKTLKLHIYARQNIILLEIGVLYSNLEYKTPNTIFSSIFLIKFRCDLYFHNLEYFSLEHFIKDRLFISEKSYITYVLSLDSVAYLCAVT